MFELQRPQAAGLYDPTFEHDACGIGAVARLDTQREHAAIERPLVAAKVAEEGQELLGWRDVPVDSHVPGPSAAEVQPVIRQVFIGSALPADADELAFERKLYVIRRVIEADAGAELAFPSFSSRT